MGDRYKYTEVECNLRVIIDTNIHFSKSSGVMLGRGIKEGFRE